ncbi:polysaccharide pyruvyl transferase family protein [Rhodococcus hoagii]|uniref:polysaccharide pyruvyl transferase family protein n=1 Tax=Rhodococcus hoagii TaxID=43767 RepID=UPI001EEABA9B|nr:polysaccharide pyruvyl transferase family protein [Prescottella equi]MBM4472272.1 polysaccharide pyruvyl transferase family protein [Prescottella equi]MBM4598887.1 polysaccharide pyruvyl transferase family protein [Prescottella equi]
MKILIMHAYSRRNQGDGLLVDETVQIVREAWPQAELDLIASEPSSFAGVAQRSVSSKPKSVRQAFSYFRTLTRIRQYDIAVAVGGGYLRARRPLDLMKMAIVHGPQLVAAGCARRAAYFPQSIGPFDPKTASVVKALLRRLDVVMVRDDRSQADLDGVEPVRSMDLALMSDKLTERRTRSVNPRPVLSVRAVGGTGDENIRLLADELRPFDSLVQSSVSGNNDVAATHKLAPAALLGHEDDDGRSPRRVFVAVRLHAALMALQQGHYVIHLAYERKGFGAFQDLGLSEFVHNVYDFKVDEVMHQCESLLKSESKRSEYDRILNQGGVERRSARTHLIQELRRICVDV